MKSHIIICFGILMNWGESGLFNQSGLTTQNAQYQQMLQQSQQPSQTKTAPMFLAEEGRDERVPEGGGFGKFGGREALKNPVTPYTSYTGDYQNPGTFRSTSVKSLSDTNIEVLNAMAPTAKLYGFSNVEEENRVQTAQTELEKKQKVRDILQTAGTASMFIPYVGAGVSVGLQSASFFT